MKEKKKPLRLVYKSNHIFTCNWSTTNAKKLGYPNHPAFELLPHALLLDFGGNAKTINFGKPLTDNELKSCAKLFLKCINKHYTNGVTFTPEIIDKFAEAFKKIIDLEINMQ
jgi:hypothetical protein